MSSSRQTVDGREIEVAEILDEWLGADYTITRLGAAPRSLHPAARAAFSYFWDFQAFSPRLLGAMALSGCASFRPPPISYDDPPEPAMLEPEPPKPEQIVEVPKLLPLPGQLKPLPGPRAAREPRDPRQRVDLANAAARIQPTRRGYLNAVQVYPFADGALYQVYAAPGQVTDIALQEGEQLVGSGRRRRYGSLDHRRHRKRHGRRQKGSHPGQADPSRTHHQPRHQHRSPHLSPRASFDREDLATVAWWPQLQKLPPLMPRDQQTIETP